jgi:hypothetical protein
MAKKKKKTPRRAGGGNFRRVTVKVARKYVDSLAKKGIRKPQDITDQGSPEKTRIAQIRLREAQYVLDDYAARLAKYEEQKAAWNALASKTEILPNGLRAKITRPAKPREAGAKSGRGGNFKPVSKKKAEAYLRGLFRKPPKQRKLDDFSLGGYMKRVNFTGAFTPRIQEAVLVAGAEKAAQIFNDAKEAQAKAEIRATEAAKKAEERKAKADERKLAAIAKCEERAKATLNKCKEDRKKIRPIVAAATAAARRKFKRMMRRR